MGRKKKLTEEEQRVKNFDSGLPVEVPGKPGLMAQIWKGVTHIFDPFDGGGIIPPNFEEKCKEKEDRGKKKK